MRSEGDADATPIISSRVKKIRGGHKATLKRLCSEVDACMIDFRLERKPVLLALRDGLEKKAEVIMKLDGRD